MGSLNNWTKATYTMMGVVKRHLHNFNPDIAFSDLDEAGLSDYVSYLRDVFCFCCFTSLKYSDVANLRRTDVFNDHIALTTIKTADRSGSS